MGIRFCCNKKKKKIANSSRQCRCFHTKDIKSQSYLIVLLALYSRRSSTFRFKMLLIGFNVFLIVRRCWRIACGQSANWAHFAAALYPPCVRRHCGRFFFTMYLSLHTNTSTELLFHIHFISVIFHFWSIARASSFIFAAARTATFHSNPLRAQRTEYIFMLVILIIIIVIFMTFELPNIIALINEKITRLYYELENEPCVCVCVPWKYTQKHAYQRRWWQRHNGHNNDRHIHPKQQKNEDRKPNERRKRQRVKLITRD